MAPGTGTIGRIGLELFDWLDSVWDLSGMCFAKMVNLFHVDSHFFISTRHHGTCACLNYSSTGISIHIQSVSDSQMSIESGVPSII